MMQIIPPVTVALAGLAFIIWSLRWAYLARDDERDGVVSAMILLLFALGVAWLILGTIITRDTLGL